MKAVFAPSVGLLGDVNIIHNWQMLIESVLDGN